MGQKVNPVGIRLGITVTGRRSGSRTRATTRLRSHQDWQVAIPEEESSPSLGEPHPHERAGAQGQHHHQHRPPGVVIGKKGEDIERLPAARWRR